VWKAHVLGHAARIVNVQPRTTGALFGQCSTMVIELQGDADDVIAFFGQHRRDNRTVNAA